MPLARSLRQAGYPGLFATTSSWGGMSTAGLPALTLDSLIDAHTYGRPGELTRDPRKEPSFLDWAAAAQVAGLPLSISEWNLSPFPAEDRFIAPLRMAAMAAHQGWDAPMLYGYAQRPLNGPTRPGNWDSGYDPGLVAMLPAAMRRTGARPVFAECNAIAPSTVAAIAGPGSSARTRRASFFI